MDGVAIVTGPRSGAGHLFRLLDNIAEVAGRDDLLRGETQDLSSQIDVAEEDARKAGKRVLAVRLTSVLPVETVEREVLSRPGMRAIFVVRRQIDAYVSLAKATALDAWRDVDTSGVKVKLDLPRFAAWMDKEAEWYGHWQRWLQLRGMPAPVLRYETHLCAPPESVLRRFTAAAGQLGIVLRVPSNLPHTGLKQQDSGKAAAFKVKNWPDFSKALIESGLEKRAFGYPI